MTAITYSHGLPEIDRAGYYELLNPVLDFAYRNPTNAIHLFEYSGRIRIGSQEYILRPGDMTCIRHGTVYRLESSDPGKHWCIHYHESTANNSAQLKLPHHLHFGASSVFYREQIQLISHLFNSPQPEENALLRTEASHRLKALLLALHNLWKNRPQSRRSRSNFSWQQLLQWINENLDRSLSLAEIAEQANLAPGTMSRKFKLEHQVSLSQFILRRRIDKAKTLLTTTTQTIHEVGTSVGIPDPQYFNKQFRKIVGMSPSHYRDHNMDFLSNMPTELATKEGKWIQSKSRK